MKPTKKQISEVMSILAKRGASKLTKNQRVIKASNASKARWDKVKKLSTGNLEANG